MAVKTSWSAGDVLAAADLTDTFAAKAPTASPTFTGTVTLSGATVVGLPAAGVILVANQSFTSAANVVFNSCFSATYENYLIVISMTTGASGSSSLRLRVGGTDATGSNYNQQRATAAGASWNLSASTTQDKWFGQGLVAGLNYFAINVFRPFTAATTAALVTSGRGTDTAIDYDVFALGHTLATSYDGFTFAFGSNSTGNCRVYGYLNS